MLKLARMGVIILLPIPAFYQIPTTVEQIVDQTVGWVPNFFGIARYLQEWGVAKDSQSVESSDCRVQESTAGDANGGTGRYSAY